jgi:hypothetical protein
LLVPCTFCGVVLLSVHLLKASLFFILSLVLIIHILVVLTAVLTVLVLPFILLS